MAERTAVKVWCDYFEAEHRLALRSAALPPPGDASVSLELWTKKTTLQTLRFDQYWIERGKLLPKGKGSPTLDALLRVYRPKCERSVDDSSRSNLIRYALGTVFPIVRHHNSHRIIDAAIRSGKQKREAAALLEELLEQRSRISVGGFARTSAGLIRNAITDPVVREPYLKFKKDICHAAETDIAKDAWDLAMVAALWREWQHLFKRRKSYEPQNIALDALSVEARMAVIEVHSHFWELLLPELLKAGVISRESYTFHALWHFTMKWAEPDQEFDMFLGHSIGLHPAAALLIASPRGAAIIEKLVRHPADESLRHSFLYAMNSALQAHADTRDDELQQGRERTQRQHATTQKLNLKNKAKQKPRLPDLDEPPTAASSG